MMAKLVAAGPGGERGEGVELETYSTVEALSALSTLPFHACVTDPSCRGHVWGDCMYGRVGRVGSSVSVSVTCVSGTSDTCDAIVEGVKWRKLELDWHTEDVSRFDDMIRTANVILSVAKKQSAPTDGVKIETYGFDVNLSKTSSVERTTRET